MTDLVEALAQPRLSQAPSSVGLMPRLSEFYGIVIYMYFGDHNPPHFHALYAEHEALFRIDDGEVLRGGLPRTASRLVDEWIELPRTELVENWQRAQEAGALVAIDPLD